MRPHRLGLALGAQFASAHEAALGQRAGKMTLALANPQQRRLRITPNGRLDELAKRLQQPGVPVDPRLASAVGPANPAAETVLAAAQLGQPPADGATSHHGRLAHRLDPAATRRQRLARRNQPPPALVTSNGATASKRDVTAATSIIASQYQHHPSRNIYILILLLRSSHDPDSFQSIRLFRPSALVLLSHKIRHRVFV